MNKRDYFEQWIPHFTRVNGRKPTRQEKMCFKIGYNAGQDSMKSSHNNNANVGGEDGNNKR